MAYALAKGASTVGAGHNVHDQDDDGASSASPSPPHLPTTYEPLHLFLDSRGNSHATSSTKGKLTAMFDSVRDHSESAGCYDMVEDDDYSPTSPMPVGALDEQCESSQTADAPLSVSQPISQIPTASTSVAATVSTPEELLVRRTSRRGVALRHPAPDLQTLQGAYMGNIEHLEKTAERLSMTSSIENAIRDLHMEQKRSDSRKSSLLSLQDRPSVSRQESNASSIVDANNAARSGGYFAAGFIKSPVGSVSRCRRSTSKSSRLGSRPEPELEGRPLDSFVNGSSMLAASIAEQDEDATTLTKPISAGVANAPQEKKEEERPATSASTNTFEQAQQMFADFDGVHTRHDGHNEEHSYTLEEHHASLWGGDLEFPGFHDFEMTPLQRALSQKQPSLRNQPSAGRMESRVRPKSFADPQTGQEMVYYPAPVPAMLNLPQKLSTQPSSMARNKRRSQVLSGVPAGARSSAIWLPDVLETANHKNVPEEDDTQLLEYIPQHQRMSMGGRRLTQDIEHLPPQLRASAYFDLPPHEEGVEIKNQSAVATLDSILDAAAYAPVNAFTDHAIAGHLGAEVYGRQRPQNRRNSTQPLTAELSNKRLSTFSMLKARPSSVVDPLQATEEKRRSTMSGFFDFRKNRSQLDLDGKDIDAIADAEPTQHSEADQTKEVSDEEEEGSEVYQGAPTTLLAELQIRKQQQKARTRPLTTIYPDGVHSTLLEMDAVAQVSQKSRKKKRVNLAWEEPNPAEEEEDDEDIPLGLLFANKIRKQQQDRPQGLIERRQMEDNEPLSRRRDRLQGRQPGHRASTIMLMHTPSPDEDDETLGQRMRRLKQEKEDANPLPHTRNVSGDFASEMNSVLGVEAPKPRQSSFTAVGEEEETLAQRRARLKAEKSAGGGNTSQPRERSPLRARRSMADIMQAHPVTNGSKIVGGNSRRISSNGLLGEHDRQKIQRANTMQMLSNQAQRIPSGGFMHHNQGSMPQQPSDMRNSMAINSGVYPSFSHPSMAWQNGGGAYNRMSGMFNPNIMFGQSNPMAIGMGSQIPNAGYPMPNAGYPIPNAIGLGLIGGMPMQPVNQGQLDMVERWRQSVMN